MPVDLTHVTHSFYAFVLSNINTECYSITTPPEMISAHKVIILYITGWVKLEHMAYIK